MVLEAKRKRKQKADKSDKPVKHSKAEKQRLRVHQQHNKLREQRIMLQQQYDRDRQLRLQDQQQRLQDQQQRLQDQQQLIQDQQDRLPQKKRVQKKQAQPANLILKDTPCSICLSDSIEDPVVLVECGHIFCFDCCKFMTRPPNICCPKCRCVSEVARKLFF